jgi:peptidoglycan/LPS O-acetylase OafA/YrhL
VDPSKARPRLHQLDGLRAVATLLVLAHHSVSEGVRRALAARGHAALGELAFHTTASGVELFFVLSGVVLLRPYLRGEREMRASTYFARRGERILPPYLGAWLFSGAVTALLTLTPTWYTESRPRFTLRGWLSQAFILRFTDVLYNEAWWSLAVEVLFYACVPLVVAAWAWRRLDLRVGLGALAVAATGSALLPLVAETEHAPWAMLYSLGVYASCFCGGVLVARLDLPRRAALALCAAGAAIVVAAAWHPWVNHHVGYGLLYTGIVQRLTARSDYRGALTSPLFVWMGERSYSLFLVHVTVFQLASNVAAHAWPGKSGAYFLATRLLGIPAAFLAAMVLFTVVERRFARGLVTAGAFWPPLRVRPPSLAAARPPLPSATAP